MPTPLIPRKRPLPVFRFQNTTVAVPEYGEISTDFVNAGRDVLLPYLFDFWAYYIVGVKKYHIVGSDGVQGDVARMPRSTPFFRAKIQQSRPKPVRVEAQCLWIAAQV